MPRWSGPYASRSILICRDQSTALPTHPVLRPARTAQDLGRNGQHHRASHDAAWGCGPCAFERPGSARARDYAVLRVVARFPGDRVPARSIDPTPGDLVDITRETRAPRGRPT